MSAAVVFGGYGVFGALVCEALAGWGIPVVVAGRDARAAGALARRLGTRHRALEVDLGRPAAWTAELRRAAVAVNCVGSPAGAAGAILDACLAADCHYVDISESRAGAARVRAADAALRRHRRVAAYGCSSLPGISGALAAAACRAVGRPPGALRATLAIGQRNAKGRGALAALTSQAGRGFAAPQGRLRALVDRYPVALPAPFGVRAARVFETADYDLLPRLGAGAVEVGVVFDLRPAGALFAAAARLGPRLGPGLARLVGAAGRLLDRLGALPGSTGGAVQVDLEREPGRWTSAVARAAAGGQRLAALPAALAVRALLATYASGGAMGALTAGELLGDEALLRELAAAGFDVRVPGLSAPRAEESTRAG